jgi:hypothetical protein
MFTAMSLASLTMILSLTSTPSARPHSACDWPPCPSTAATSRGQISFARAFVGGQDVVQIIRSERRRTPFMEVKASDLLISYVYDLKGHLIDRKVWFEQPEETACCMRRSML